MFAIGALPVAIDDACVAIGVGSVDDDPETQDGQGWNGDFQS